MKTQLTILVLTASVTLVAEETVKQKTCPVMGGKVNKALYADVEGHRVYVCCKGCISAVKKTPEKYLQVLEQKGESVAKVQTTCPVMGGKINRKYYADVKGKRIYVCCPGCVGTIKNDPDTYINKLKKNGVVPDSVPKNK